MTNFDLIWLIYSFSCWYFLLRPKNWVNSWKWGNSFFTHYCQQLTHSLLDDNNLLQVGRRIPSESISQRYDEHLKKIILFKLQAGELECNFFTPQKNIHSRKGWNFSPTLQWFNGEKWLKIHDNDDDKYWNHQMISK